MVFDGILLTPFLLGDGPCISLCIMKAFQTRDGILKQVKNSFRLFFEMNTLENMSFTNSFFSEVN